MSTRMSPLAWLLGAGAVGTAAWFVTRSKSVPQPRTASQPRMAPQPRTAGAGAPHPFVSTGAGGYGAYGGSGAYGGMDPMSLAVTSSLIEASKPRDSGGGGGGSPATLSRLQSWESRVQDRALAFDRMLIDEAIKKYGPSGFSATIDAKTLPAFQADRDFYRKWREEFMTPWLANRERLAKLYARPFGFGLDLTEEYLAVRRIDDQLNLWSGKWGDRLSAHRAHDVVGFDLTRDGFFELHSKVRDLDEQLQSQAVAIDRALLSQAVRKYGPEGFATGLSALSADDMPEFVVDRDFYRKWRTEFMTPWMANHEHLQGLYGKAGHSLESAYEYTILKKFETTLADWRQDVERRGLAVRW
ncbi:MAG: hypothetical protein ACHREM_02250 [Polyangiales bacterium]